jgi:hypothetical protein
MFATKNNMTIMRAPRTLFYFSSFSLLLAQCKYFVVVSFCVLVATPCFAISKRKKKKYTYICFFFFLLKCANIKEIL